MKFYSLVSACVLISLSFSLFANVTYYSTEFVQNIEENQNHPEVVRQIIFETISKNQRTLDYGEARRAIYNELFLQKNDSGAFIEDCYCEHFYTTKRSKLNIEHSWPQSLFSKKYDKFLQKSDLHHLFPVDTVANSTRGHYPFGEVVVKDIEIPSCDASSFGTNSRGELVFEPKENIKGDIARAVFYFATRYQMSIENSEEEILKKWNKEDPVSAFELEKNNKVMMIQGNRNPYIDAPNLIDLVKDF